MENNNIVYVVKGFYDLCDNGDSEILYEIYKTEELAKQRVRQLIDKYKEYNGLNYPDYRTGTELEETEFSLYAWGDDWDVDISYTVEVVKNSLDSNE